MSDVLGFTVQEAVLALESREGKPVRILETSGYKASQDMDAHTDARVIGIRITEPEILLITAKF